MTTKNRLVKKGKFDFLKLAFSKDILVYKRGGRKLPLKGRYKWVNLFGKKIRKDIITKSGPKFVPLYKENGTFITVWEGVRDFDHPVYGL